MVQPKRKFFKCRRDKQHSKILMMVEIGFLHFEYFRKLKKNPLKGVELGREDGGGVNGSHTNLLPGPIWNYNSIVEEPPGTNN